MASELDRLREVARLIAQYHVGRTGHIAFDDPEDTYSRLCTMLLDESRTDAAIVAAFAKDKSDSYLSSVTTQTKQRLYNMMFSLRLDGGSAVRASIYQNNKDVFLCEVFTMLGLRASAARLANKALKRSTELGLTGNTLHFLRVLRRNAALSGDQKAHRHYAEAIRRALEQYAVETEAEISSEEVTSRLAVTGHSSDEARTAASKAVRRLRHYAKRHDSLTTRTLYYRVATMHAALTGDFETCASLCDEALGYYDTCGASVSPSHRGEFIVRRLEAALHLGDLQTAERHLRDATAIFQESSINWFVIKNYEFLLLMHRSRFDDAADLAASVRSSSRFNTLDEQRQTRWRLYSLYALTLSGQARIQGSRTILRELEDIGDALSQYKTDKEGYNLLLLILESLILLDLGQLKSFMDLHDKLRVYKNRHLKPGTRGRAILDLLSHVSKHLDDPSSLRLTEPVTATDTAQSLIMDYSVFREHLQVTLDLLRSH